MLIFGGAIYAGRTRAWAERGAVALLLVALLLQTLNVLGVANLEGPLAVLALMIVLGALVATFAEWAPATRHDVRTQDLDALAVTTACAAAQP